MLNEEYMNTRAYLVTRSEPEKFLTSFHIDDSVKPVHRHDMPRQCSLNH